MKTADFNNLLAELREETSGIDGCEIVIRGHDIRILHDGTDDEYEVSTFAEFKKLVTAIKTLQKFRSF